MLKLLAEIMCQIFCQYMEIQHHFSIQEAQHSTMCAYSFISIWHHFQQQNGSIEDAN